MAINTTQEQDETAALFASTVTIEAHILSNPQKQRVYDFFGLTVDDLKQIAKVPNTARLVLDRIMKELMEARQEVCSCKK